MDRLAGVPLSYAAQQDLIDRFGATELTQLTDRVNKPPTTIDADVVARALGDADAQIDSYLGKLYLLPLSATPPVLIKIEADLARYALHGKAADKDGAVARAYSDALKWLQAVAAGLVQLDVDGVTVAQPDGSQVRSSGAKAAFTRESLGRFF